MRSRTTQLSLLLLIGCSLSGPATANAAGPCTKLINGTSAADDLRGTFESDRILGLAGDDQLFGLGGGDCLAGADGGDLLEGGVGPDALDGGSGPDELNGDDDGDRLEGGAGDDQLRGGANDDRSEGGAGNDLIEEVGDGYRASQTIDAGSNTVDAGPGKDIVNVANGRSDRVDCGSNSDRVRADGIDKLEKCEERMFMVSPFPQVSPRATDNRKRSFLVRFRSLTTTISDAEFFSITVSGPGKCREIVSNSVGTSYSRDRTVPYRLQPFSGSGSAARKWCAGLYRGSVDFISIDQAGCRVTRTQPPDRDCTTSRRIGVFSFRVR